MGMSRRIIAIALSCVGCGLAAVGVGLIYVPAALILLGIVSTGAGLLVIDVDPRGRR